MSKEADSPVVVRGSARAIEYAVCQDGSMPAKELIEGRLTIQEQMALVALFQRMAEHGSIPNREQFKHVQGKIFEFKKHQIRVFCFRQSQTWYLTNGYKKKKDRLDPGEIDRAERIMGEHQARGTKKGR